MVSNANTQHTNADQDLNAWNVVWYGGLYHENTAVHKKTSGFLSQKKTHLKSQVPYLTFQVELHLAEACVRVTAQQERQRRGPIVQVHVFQQELLLCSCTRNHAMLAIAIPAAVTDRVAEVSQQIGFGELRFAFMTRRLLVTQYQYRILSYSG
eukprot:scpid96152/ scgid23039/ 